MSGRFIAIDWGTTNRRAMVIEDDAVVATERDGPGAAAVAEGGFPAELAGLRARLGDLPVVMAGMVGSSVGWQVAPYVAAPCGIAEIAAALLAIDPRTAIVPGVSHLAPHADVMRGEEVLLLGAVEARLAPRNALVCQPGTHCKWAVLEDARIVHFTTAMTGELFALLRAHGLLARQLGSTVVDGPAFRAGVAEGLKRDLAASLFGIRASGLLGQRDDADAASYASGLLIGADVAPRLAEHDGEVVVVADPALGALYVAAIAAAGGAARLVDADTAFVAGISRIRELAA